MSPSTPPPTPPSDVPSHPVSNTPRGPESKSARKVPPASGPEKTSRARLAGLFAREVRTGVIGVLAGIQCFWVLYKGDVAPVEFTWDLLGLVGAFLVPYLVAVACRFPRTRARVQRSEPFLHGLAAAGYVLLLVGLQARDEFHLELPFSWTFHAWTWVLGVDLLAHVASMVRAESPIPRAWVRDRTRAARFGGITALAYALLVTGAWFARAPQVYWIVATIVHAGSLAGARWHGRRTGPDERESPGGGGAPGGSPTPAPLYASLRDLVARHPIETELDASRPESWWQVLGHHARAIFLVATVISAWAAWGLAHLPVGAIEVSYPALVGGLFLSPACVGGVALALVAFWADRHGWGDAAIVGCLSLAIWEIAVLLPLVVGYATTALALSACQRPVTSRTSYTVALLLAWTVGLLALAYNAMLLDTAEAVLFMLEVATGGEFPDPVTAGTLTAALVAICGIALLVTLLLHLADHAREGKHPSQPPVPTPVAAPTPAPAPAPTPASTPTSGLTPTRVPRRPPAREPPRALPHASSRGRSRARGVLLLVLVAGGLVTPFLVLTTALKAPPLVDPPSTRKPLTDFCGTALAGYSGTPEEYGNLTALGVQWLRVHFSWRGIEPAPDVFDFTRWDRYVANCTTHGIKIIAMLNYPPSWLAPDSRNYVAPADLPHYLDYVNRTVRRYGHAVAAWEIWNEPNLERFWDGPMEHYYELFGEAVALIHAIDPTLYIVGGSMSSASTGWFPPNVEEMFQRGLMADVDALSIHFYNYDPAVLYQGIRQYVALGTKYNFTGDYLVTEIGNPTNGTYPHVVSPRRLAENVVKKLVIASRLPVDAVVWYCTRDSGNASDPRVDWLNSERWFGLTTRDYHWKPGAYAFQLFSQRCGTSEVRPDLVQERGGLATRDLQATAYLAPAGNLTLVLWYDPAVPGPRTTRVVLEVPDPAGGDAPVRFDVHDGTCQALPARPSSPREFAIEVGEAPVVIGLPAGSLAASTGGQFAPLVLHVPEPAGPLVVFIGLPALLALVVLLPRPRRPGPQSRPPRSSDSPE